MTLTVSPRQCILLSHQDFHGYLDIKNTVVDAFNRRTRFNANEYFVVNRNIKKDIWFDPGEEPEDSWEKTQKRKETGADQDKNA